MNGEKTRSCLMGIVGGYLIYTAWQLFQGRNDPETTMTIGVMILFMVLFVIAGVGLMVYAVILWKKGMAEDKEEKQVKEEEDGLK
ncbi:MAG: hypothetical protein IKP22_01975 [Clostridia bacterium]|nr:hypothetical protein [Clostridia bacterium]